MHLTTDGFESRVPTAPLLAIVRASGCGNRILSRKRTHIFLILLFAVGCKLPTERSHELTLTGGS